MEKQRGCDIRLLSTWGKRLEALGFWYDQLLSESLGKRERGAMPLTVVNTRDLHSRGQQHQEGKRDKLITNIIVDEGKTTPIPIGTSEFNQDGLNELAEKTIPDVLAAATQGTNKAYRDDNRPTADLRCTSDKRIRHGPAISDVYVGNGCRRSTGRDKSLRPTRCRSLQKEHERNSAGDVNCEDIAIVFGTYAACGLAGTDRARVEIRSR